MNYLLFSNPVFNIGRNVTVRRGVKWGAVEEGEFGFPVADTKEPHKIIGFAQNISRRVMRFVDIAYSEDILKKEHDPDCQTYEGLISVMQKLYSDFSEFEIVTIMEFDFITSNQEKN